MFTHFITKKQKGNSSPVVSTVSRLFQANVSKIYGERVCFMIIIYQTYRIKLTVGPSQLIRCTAPVTLNHMHVWYCAKVLSAAISLSFANKTRILNIEMEL